MLPKTEQEILADVEMRTGYRLARVESLPLEDASVMSVVLPVYATWVDRVESNYRAAIYTCFVPPAARPFLEQLLAWWLSEKHEHARDVLTQMIAGLSDTPKAARIVWDTVKSVQRAPLLLFLLARLASHRAIRAEVIAKTLSALTAGEYDIGELAYVARVKDPQIQGWLAAQLDSSHPVVRRLARKAAGKAPARPRCVVASPGGPDRSTELYSTEVDTSDSAAVLHRLEGLHGFRTPSGLLDGAALESLEVNQWVRHRLEAAAHGAVLDLWFRLEDVDTVEIVLTAGRLAGRSPGTGRRRLQ